LELEKYSIDLLLSWGASLIGGHGELLREQDQLRQQLRRLPFFRMEVDEEGRCGPEHLQQPGVVVSLHDGAPDP
jgi:hypothetical protein